MCKSRSKNNLPLFFIRVIILSTVRRRRLRWRRRRIHLHRNCWVITKLTVNIHLDKMFFKWSTQKSIGWLPMSQNHILDFAKSKSVSTCLCCFTSHYSSTQLSGFIGTQPKLFLTKCSRYWILSHTNLGQHFRLFGNEIWFN